MSIENLKEFNLALDKAGKTLTEKQFVLFHKRVALDVINGTIRDTPVDIGRLRANWLTTIGEQTERVIEGSDDFFRGISEEEIKQAALLVLAKLSFAQVIFLQNNVNYVLFIENGTPKIPAQRMLQSNLERATIKFIKEE